MISTELQAILDLMSDFPAPWWVCGGWSLDLYRNHRTRPHKDVDITIWRSDQTLLHDFLADWTLQVAHDGKLEPWKPGTIIELPLHIIWCTNPNFEPAFLEILLNEVDDCYFYFRRNQNIKLEREKAFTTTENGVPILAPEITLLYKSKTPDENDTIADFTNTLPYLDREQAEWLRRALQLQYDEHPWLRTIESTIP